ncbi:coiled-coil flagellar protein, move backward only 2 [Trypanosoma theileri]|uniref:Coiled-coil flagellar protein, move backward only 2 n=1 Tax=Trypanosoma theileri TaxID=67003 RepID=A0A1X0P9Q4_9TRYP|nr:coiled-coil flagellar protein, move backward only 2 [Trypanosoma theileri]ORC93646.1 coiled-coil flagellar protein, move backward only 2 [Trypanosoma theileri]
MTDVVQLFDDATDVSHSSAVLVLNTLVEEGRIIEERAEYLKQKFKELHNRVLVVYKRDNFLLKRARQLRKELDTEKERIAARGTVAVEDDTEIQRLKKVLMEAENELSEAQERESILQVEALEFDRKKHTMLLEREDALAAEEARLRPRMEALQAEMNAMGKEIEDMTTELQTIGAKRDEILAEETECKEKLRHWNEIMADATKQLTNVEKAPERAMKQTEIVIKSYQAAQLELSALDEKLQVQMDMIAKLELKKNTRNTDYTQAQANLRKLKAQIDSKRITIDTLNTSLEMELEARQGYQQRIAQLEQLIKTTHIARETELGNVEHVHREMERTSAAYTELEHTVANILKEQQDIKENIGKVKKHIERVQGVRKRNAQRLEDEQRVMELRTRAFMREQSREEGFIAKAEAVREDIAALKSEINGRALQEEVKRRETAALVVRRQELNRDCARENSRIKMGKDELRMKEMHVNEVRKRRDELEHRLNSITEMFQNIKRERSHKAAQIQAVTQKMTEMSEKKTILENELAVLCRESALKETELTRKKRQVQELRQICKNLRMDKNRQRKNLEKVSDEERNIKNEVRRVNEQIASLEEDMEDVKNTYNEVIEGRNYAGVQLLDRNDELCVLYARVNAQEKAIRDGVLMDNARRDEIRALQIKLADLRREVDVVQKSVPKVKELEAQLETLVDEIDDERWKIEVLENDLTNPKNPYRWRVISRKTAGREFPTEVEGKHADTANTTLPGASTLARSGVEGPSDEFLHLQQRCLELEERVNAINERIREKDLILEEVTELTSRVTEQAKSGREFTLALAKQVNSHHSSIRAKTRQMMATVSELSVFQASAIQLKQDVQRLECLVEEAERNMQQGEAPFAEAEERYLREIESRRRYADMLRHRKEKEAEATAASKTLITTAEQRPNAYIPDDGLSVPKPFGALVPFKPTPMVQSSRFYRSQVEHYQAREMQNRVMGGHIPVDQVSSGKKKTNVKSNHLSVTH